MQDHNSSIPPVESDGSSSVGQSNNGNFSPRESSPEPALEPFRLWGCFTERALVYVDCHFARNAYLGREWADQLKSECERQYEDLKKIKAARQAFGAEAIPYGLTMRSPNATWPTLLRSLSFAVLLGLLTVGHKTAEQPFFVSHAFCISSRARKGATA